MSSSLKTMKMIPAELLAERIELVQKLEEQEAEGYEIVKDKLTGEHFLHYYYMQVNLLSAGEEEMYYQLMPIDHDEVLRLVFEKTDYHYPDHWKASFLRNGPDDQYIWFSPDYAIEFDESVKLGQDIAEKLKQFKQAGVNDEQAIKKLWDELDNLHKKD